MTIKPHDCASSAPSVPVHRKSTLPLPLTASRAIQFHFQMVCCVATHIVLSSINYKLLYERLFDLEGPLSKLWDKKFLLLWDHPINI